MKVATVLALACSVGVAGCMSWHHGRGDYAMVTMGGSPAPSASPNCDKSNTCRVYLTVEKDSTGQEKIHVYPYDLETHSAKKAVKIVWILLTPDTEFDGSSCNATPERCPIRIVEPDGQFSEPYPTDNDDGQLPALRAVKLKNFHWKLKQKADIKTYTYEIAVIKNGTKITRDPTITNRD